MKKVYYVMSAIALVMVVVVAVVWNLDVEFSVKIQTSLMATAWGGVSFFSVWAESIRGVKFKKRLTPLVGVWLWEGFLPGGLFIYAGAHEELNLLIKTGIVWIAFCMTAAMITYRLFKKKVATQMS